jgi:hypothetical protein
MEKVYLFSVRYIHGASITWQGVGTAAVLVGVVGIVVLQLSFTYIPVMQRLFQTRSIASRCLMWQSSSASGSPCWSSSSWRSACGSPHSLLLAISARASGA